MDIDAGHALVEAIKPHARTTARPGADPALGGFGAIFDLRAAGYRDPLLVASTDGVGTKLRIASETSRHGTVGIDLVAMCVNDLVVQGAEPLFFLDYYAAGRLEVEVARQVVAGIAEGCRLAGCALIGGETAEMPGHYRGGDYDLAGFAVGAVEREALITGADVVEGDMVLGLASSGLHANGFSLVRRFIAEAGLDLASPAPFAPEQSLGDALLTPTRIYVRSMLAAIRGGGIKAVAHVTGGGLIDNIPRVLPPHVGAVLDPRTWPLPGVFRWLKQGAGLDDWELARTFNCGLGMVAVVSSANADAVATVLAHEGETVFRVGRVEAAGEGPRVRLLGAFG